MTFFFAVPFALPAAVYILPAFSLLISSIFSLFLPLEYCDFVYSSGFLLLLLCDYARVCLQSLLFYETSRYRVLQFVLNV